VIFLHILAANAEIWLNIFMMGGGVQAHEDCQSFYERYYQSICFDSGQLYAIMRSMNKNSQSSIEELHAYVYGRVQGVGYRYFVVQKAHTLALHGYARNESDGSVEVLAQGPRPALEQLLSYLRQGPSAARVRDVRVTWSTPTEHISGFHVRW